MLGLFACCVALGVCVCVCVCVCLFTVDQHVSNEPLSLSTLDRTPIFTGVCKKKKKKKKKKKNKNPKKSPFLSTRTRISRWIFCGSVWNNYETIHRFIQIVSTHRPFTLHVSTPRMAHWAAFYSSQCVKLHRFSFGWNPRGSPAESPPECY